MHFSQLWKLRDLDLDLRSGRGHTGAHMWSRSTHTHQIRRKSEKKLFVDVRTDTPEFQSTRSSVGDDLKIECKIKAIELVGARFSNFLLGKVSLEFKVHGMLIFQDIQMATYFGTA